MAFGELPRTEEGVRSVVEVGEEVGGAAPGAVLPAKGAGLGDEDEATGCSLDVVKGDGFELDAAPGIRFAKEAEECGLSSAESVWSDGQPRCCQEPFKWTCSTHPFAGSA